MFLLHFVMFGCIYYRFVATLNSVQMGQSGAINAKVRATKSHMNLSLRMRPIHTIGPKTQVLVCFVMFGCTWDRFATALNLVQNGPYWCNWCKSSCHEVASELFATKARERHHGTLNSCFVAFCKVWVHLGSFRYCTKLGAKGPIWCNYCKSLCHDVTSDLSLRTCQIHTIGP